jgi:Holliday junction resolvase RusA-like endonuclease
VRHLLLIHGPPAQKKNSPQIGYVGKRCPLCKRGQPRVFPSKEYRIWSRAAIQELRAQWRGMPPLGDKKVGLIVTATFYLAKGQHFDLSNLIEAVGDVLEEAGVVTSDYYIDSWGTSHRDRDPDNPRVEIEVIVSAARR